MLSGITPGLSVLHLSRVGRLGVLKWPGREDQATRREIKTLLFLLLCTQCHLGNRPYPMIFA